MMPSTSKKQHNFMAAVAHNPAFAKKAGVPQSVGKEFNKADKGKTFKQGGDMKTNAQFDDDVTTVKRALYKQPGDATLYSRERGLKPGMARRRLDERGVDVRALAVNEANPEDLGSYKKGGNVKKMNMGGMAKADMKQDKGMMQKAVNKHEGRLHKGQPMTKLAKGGYTKAADGIASKGKTKGTQIKMSKGGRAC